jgi:hypothetical protein
MRSKVTILSYLHSGVIDNTVQCYSSAIDNTVQVTAVSLMPLCISQQCM